MKTPDQNPGLNRRAFITTAAFAGVGLALAQVLGKDKTAAKSTLPLDTSLPTPRPKPRNPNAPNVLFIAIDDLRAWTHFLGNDQVITPNLDRLAAMGVVFTRNYCPASLCNPSRTAVVTGLRPSTTGIYDNQTKWTASQIATEVPRLPGYFHDNGYVTCGAGKISHNSEGEWDDYGRFIKERDLEGAGKDEGVGLVTFNPLDCADKEMLDYDTASYCIRQLEKEHEGPLFLGCGFVKPHLPFEAPKKYFDMYPLDKIKIPEAPAEDLDDIPHSGVLMAKPKAHEMMVQSGRWKEAVRAYLACITFMDSQLGRVLDALERSRYRDNTIIVLWCDHGWHHGEKQHWRKTTLWEEGTRVPLIWVAPGVTTPGGVCNRVTDSLHIYPTLCELAGLPLPPHLEGKSIRPLLAKPDDEWDGVGITTMNPNNHAVRTAKWRYIRYANGDEELYDHDNDPNEWKNLVWKDGARDPSLAPILAQLRQHLPKTNAPGRANPKKERRAKKQKRQLEAEKSE